MKESYTAQEVCRLGLVTHRQLQWWDEQGIISPDQSTGKRLYTPHELYGVMLYRELYERGFSLAAFRQVWRAIDRQAVELPDPSKRWLLTDGERVVFMCHSEVVLAFLEQRRSPAFVLVPLAPLNRKLAGEGLELPERIGPASERVCAMARAKSA